MQVDKEAAIMVRDREGTMQLTPQDNHVMSKHRVLSLKPQLRLEWRGQDGQSEPEQPDHSASLGDSITSSTRIRFSVRTERFSNGVAKTTSSRTRQFSYAFTLRKASRSTERKGESPDLESNLPGARLHFNRSSDLVGRRCNVRFTPINRHRQLDRLRLKSPNSRRSTRAASRWPLRIDFVVAWRRPRAARGRTPCDLVPGPVSSHTDMVRPQILR